jgi:dinuclear metal center YbgI/SA1388 family protein
MTDCRLDAFCQTLSEIAPLSRAEGWDNVGLLAGDRSADLSRVITCLTVTEAVVEEAIDERVDLVVTHHPIPFRPLARITTDSITGRFLWRLIGAGVAIYSAHTAFDSAGEGINQTWADRLELADVSAIVDPDDQNDLGSGRIGTLGEPTRVTDVLKRCREIAGSAGPLRAAGKLDRNVRRVGFACGSGGSFLAKANRKGCELLVTGEATFHQCLEAESLGMTLGLLGHYQSERFAMELLARRLASEWPNLSIWPSRKESDPIVLV